MGTSPFSGAVSFITPTALPIQPYGMYLPYHQPPSIRRQPYPRPGPNPSPNSNVRPLQTSCIRSQKSLCAGEMGCISLRGRTSDRVPTLTLLPTLTLTLTDVHPNLNPSLNPNPNCNAYCDPNPPTDPINCKYQKTYNVPYGTQEH